MATELDFTGLEEQEEPFTYKKVDYILHEASGDAAVKYRNAMLACTTLGPEGKVQKIEGLASVEPLLVSLCVTRIDARTNKVIRVGEPIVRGWPNRMLKQLYAKVKEISDLDDGEDLEALRKQRDELDAKITQAEASEERAKNLLSNTTDGSD